VDGVHGALLSSGYGHASLSPDRRTLARTNNSGGAFGCRAIDHDRRGHWFLRPREATD
jgi:hypothetical protein